MEKKVTNKIIARSHNPMYNVRDSMSREDDGLRESTIRNQRREKTARNDGSFSRNEDESRRGSSRKRKTRRETPDGIIVDFSNDVYGTSRCGIKISVISMRNLTKPDAIPPPKKLPSPRYSMRSRARRKKEASGTIANPIIAVFYENYNNAGRAERSTRRKLTNNRKARRYAEHDPTESMENALRPNVNAIVNGPNRLEDSSSDRTGDNLQSSARPPEKITDSTVERCYRDNNALLNADNALRRAKRNTEETCVCAGKHIANSRCERAIFDDQRREFQFCKDYNANVAEFDTETRADCSAECFYRECAHAKACLCSYSCEYCPDLNTRCDCCSISRATELLKDSIPPKERRRNDAERSAPHELRTNVAFESAKPEEEDEYSVTVECGSRCANRSTSSASTIRRKCTASRTSVFVETGGGSLADLRESGIECDSRCEIDTAIPAGLARERTKMRGNDERPNKSDSRGAAADARDAHAGEVCIGSYGSNVAAEKPACSGQFAGAEGELARGVVDSKWKHSSIETDAQQLDYNWKRRIATVDVDARAGVDFKGKRDSRSQTRSDNVNNADGKHRETREHSLWTNFQIGKIWSQVHDACKNVVKLAVTSVGRVVAKDVSKSEGSRKNPIEMADATFVESPSPRLDNIYGETCRKNLMRSRNEAESEAYEKRRIGNVEKYNEDANMSTRESLRTITSSRHDTRVCQNAEEEKNGGSCVFCGEYERDKYRNVIKPPLRIKTRDQDDDTYPRSVLSRSCTSPEDPAYPGRRNRGGSDGNKDSTRSAEVKREPTNDIEKATFLQHRCDSNPRKRTSYIGDRESRVHYADSRGSLHATVSYESIVTTDNEAIRADISHVSRSNPLDRELRSANASSSTDNGRTKARYATLEQTRFREEIETRENAENTVNAFGWKSERNLTSMTEEVADAISVVDSSQNEPDESIASTFKWKAPVSEDSRTNRSASVSSKRATTMKFWKKGPAVDNDNNNNKAIASVFKRRWSIGIKERSAVTQDSGMKITQIEPSTEQTAREGNKRRTYVNVQVQTSDWIVTRILSEILVSGEKKKRVLMSITLQSESDRDVSDRNEISLKDVETQTSSNDVTSVGIDAFSPDGRPPAPPFTITSKTVQCFVCDKQNCYEIKNDSDDSITLEESLIAEYPEKSEFDDRFAERRTEVSTIPSEDISSKPSAP